ncbi:shikimate dehydrogenase [Haematospirillum sp. 15-248]|uniref:shikimate dehydrogenase n=1 Tax=Haematospirillum sp. 15-248 TaxID=2723107 RepID=UPI00143979CD|nr:shikimate dehydrogenase [Haematospirillum sp. 15-248]NKD88318.1 shikimate dehydrogenase [Haematospirillum sp. 15-248]
MIISGHAKLAGILGWPVSHSASPCLHGFWLDAYGVDGAFVPLPVHPDDLELVVRALPRMGFCGVNVTIPHKEAVLNLCDSLSETARAAGSVNTLTFSTDGSIYGDTTDGDGFMRNVQDQAGPVDSKGPVLVLGAGGAARSIVLALIRAGFQDVLIANRTPEKAEAIARDLGAGITVVEWDNHKRFFPSLSLLVNTTSLGMTGCPPLSLSLDTLSKQAVVCDIVYKPLETTFLATARRRGNRVVDGLGMLLHQACPGFRSWFGVMPTVDNVLRDHVIKSLNLV